MDKKSELGNFIMAIFKNFIESQNEKECKGKDYKAIKAFKPQKATQAKLAEILENNTSNISAYLNGEIKIPMSLILDIAEKLDVTSEDFFELAKLFAMQDIEFIVSDYSSKDMPIITKINQSFIESVTARLLFEFYKTKAPTFMEKRWDTAYFGRMNRLHEKYNKTFYIVNSTPNLEIAKIIFDDKAKKKQSQ